MELTLMCINCGCESKPIDSRDNNNYKTKQWIDDEIKKLEKQDEMPDVVILTEVVIDKNTKWPGYKVYPGPRNYYQDNSKKLANQVVIAVKEGITVTDDDIVTSYEPSVHFPDCQWIKINVGGKSCNIIGFRMPAVTSYYDRKCLFDKFVKYVVSKIQPGEITILAGDFNNARCHGSLHKSFNAVESCYYNNGKQLPQYPYNLHRINDSLSTMGLKLIDIDMDNDTWPYRDRTTNQLLEPYVPDDHIFISSGTKAEVTFYPENLYDEKYPLDHKYFIANITL